MSYWVAEVGELIIKPEYRKDFGHFFRNEYEAIECEPLIALVDAFRCSYSQLPEESREYYMSISNWSHKDMDESWHGKYHTTYDEDTGLFSYGLAYNFYRSAVVEMMIAFDETLEIITEKAISQDFWEEGG